MLADTTTDALPGTEIVAKIALITSCRPICAPNLTLCTRADTLAAAVLFVVRVHGLENILCRLPRNDEGKLAVFPRRSQLLAQTARIDGVGSLNWLIWRRAINGFVAVRWRGQDRY